MRSQHYISVAIPIPGHVPPEFVLSFIQTYTPLMQANTALREFTEVPADVNAIIDDPFFGTPNNSLRAFEVHESMPMAPGITKETRWPVHFQCIPDGIRSRANAAINIVARAEWTVRQRQDSGSSPGSDSTGSTMAAEWELCDEVVIEANSLLMPFISKTADKSHRDITERVLEAAAKAYSK